MKKSEINEALNITEITEKPPLSLFFNPNTARKIYSEVNLVDGLPSSFVSKQPAMTEAPKVAKGPYEAIPEPGSR